MKEKTKNILTLVLCGAFLLSLSVWRICKPSDLESLSERRKLTQFPTLNAQTLLSGSFMSEYEDYTLDQFPLRDSFRTLKAWAAGNVFGQRDNNGLYAQDGYLSKLDYPLNVSSVENAATRFRAVYERYLQNATVYFTVVPDKNYYTDASYPKMDYAALTALLSEQMDYAQYIDITGDLTLESYYRTDPHWEQTALLPAAATLLAAMGGTQRDSYEAVVLDTPFYGSLYSQSALPFSADTLAYLTSETLQACRVYDYETEQYISVYQPEAAQGRDGYELFLAGSKSLLTIENPNAQTQKELIVFRDSFGSSIVPLLVEGYAKVTLVDIRYIQPERLAYFLSFASQDVLFLYSASVLNNSDALK